MVNEDRMRHTFEDLVKIDAPSKGEREVCDYLKKKLRALALPKSPRTITARSMAETAAT